MRDRGFLPGSPEVLHGSFTRREPALLSWDSSAARQTVPAAPPDKSPQLSGAELGEQVGLSRPLLARLDLSALNREPLRAQSPPSHPQEAQRHSKTYVHLQKRARGCAWRKNVCCLFRVSLAPFQPFSLIHCTFACESVIPII